MEICGLSFLPPLPGCSSLTLSFLGVITSATASGDTPAVIPRGGSVSSYISVAESFVLTEVDATVNIDQADISVTDNIPGVNPVLVPGQAAAADGILQPGETWRYQATGTAINLLDTIMVGRLPKSYSIAGQAAIGHSLIWLWAVGGFLSAVAVGTQAIANITLQVMGNLVDNACKWAGSAVSIGVVYDAGPAWPGGLNAGDATTDDHYCAYRMLFHGSLFLVGSLSRSLVLLRNL